MKTPRRVRVLDRKSLRLTIAWIALACPLAFAQGPAVPGTPSPSPAFDVATIKPHEPGSEYFGVRNTPTEFIAFSAALAWLVNSAYGLPAMSKVIGGPDWAQTEMYDIQAKMSGADIAAMSTLSPADQKTRRQLMLQALLADRFKLKTHTETRQVPVFDLVTTKDISKLKVSPAHPDNKVNKDGTPSGTIHFGSNSASVVGESMSSFAAFLSSPMAGVGRPVVDKTGLTSTYNFTLNWSLPKWSKQPGAASATMSEEDAASIFQALKEVGLKLQPSTGPIDITIIDHAERPSEN